MLLNVTVDADNWSMFQPQLERFLETLPADPVSYPGWSPTPLPPNEGLTIPAQVNYVAKGANPMVVFASSVNSRACLAIFLIAIPI
jgi:hypothetical protein